MRVLTLVSCAALLVLMAAGAGYAQSGGVLGGLPAAGLFPMGQWLVDDDGAFRPGAARRGPYTVALFPDHRGGPCAVETEYDVPRGCMDSFGVCLCWSGAQNWLAFVATPDGSGDVSKLTFAWKSSNGADVPVDQQVDAQGRCRFRVTLQDTGAEAEVNGGAVRSSWSGQVARDGFGLAVWPDAKTPDKRVRVRSFRVTASPGAPGGGSTVIAPRVIPTGDPPITRARHSSAPEISVPACHVERLAKELRKTVDRDRELKKRVSKGWIAVAQFDLSGVESVTIAEDVRDTLTTCMVREKFGVVQRAQLDKVLREQGLQDTALVDADTRKAVGKLTGADVILSGTIADVGQKVKLTGILVDVETGQALPGAAVIVEFAKKPITGKDVLDLGLTLYDEVQKHIDENKKK